VVNLARPHFVYANWAFNCSECLEQFPANTLMLVHRERLARAAGSIGSKTVYLCEACGRLLLESEKLDD
jgi:hypothetical protein